MLCSAKMSCAPQRCRPWGLWTSRLCSAKMSSGGCGPRRAPWPVGLKHQDLSPGPLARLGWAAGSQTARSSWWRPPSKGLRLTATPYSTAGQISTSSCPGVVYAVRRGLESGQMSPRMTALFLPAAAVLALALSFGPPRAFATASGLMQTPYKRTGGSLRVRTGAGTTSSVDFDRRGLPLRHIRLSVPVTDGSLGAGVVVERLQVGGGWLPVDAAGAGVGRDASEPSELLVLLRSGWERDASYGVGLSSSLTDGAGRSFMAGGGESSHTLEWTVPTGTPEISEPPVIFEQRFGLRYESHLAAADTVGGRFPGGQTTLFQGLWTDPVTGIAYARARWYDSRNASWLSADPLANVDSPNLEGRTATQIRDRFALPGSPKYISDVNVPAGIQLRVGTVGGQPGWGAGGGILYELLGRLPGSALTNRRLIP